MTKSDKIGNEGMRGSLGVTNVAENPINNGSNWLGSDKRRNNEPRTINEMRNTVERLDQIESGRKSLGKI